MEKKYHKKTNIDKLKNANMDNKIIVNPPGTFNHLLLEKNNVSKFSITAFNPQGYTAIMIIKEIALIPLSFLIYKLLTPKRKMEKKEPQDNYM